MHDALVGLLRADRHGLQGEPVGRIAPHGQLAGRRIDVAVLPLVVLHLGGAIHRVLLAVERFLTLPGATPTGPLVRYAPSLARRTNTFVYYRCQIRANPPKRHRRVFPPGCVVVARNSGGAK